MQGGSVRQRQDDFLLTASHVFTNPHNYTPRHSHSTRFLFVQPLIQIVVERKGCASAWIQHRKISIISSPCFNWKSNCFTVWLPIVLSTGVCDIPSAFFRYKQWYSSTFKEGDLAEGSTSSKRNSVQSDSPTILFLLILLIFAIGLPVFFVFPRACKCFSAQFSAC